MFGGGRARRAQPRPAERRARPQAPGGGGDRARPRRARRRARRGDASRARSSGSGLGPDACLARNGRAGLRPDDRLGPGRAVEPGRRPRHELHRDHRRPARPRPGPGPAALPDQPARRLRRRLDVPRHRHPRRAPRGAHSGRGQVVDAAIVDGTAHLNAMASTFAALGLDTGTRALGPARRRHALLRPLRDRRRRAHERRRRWSRSSTPSWSAARASTCPTATTRPTTPAIREALTTRSRSAPRPSGPSSSTAPTPASRPSSRSPTRRATRTCRARHLRRAGRVTQPAPGAALLAHRRHDRQAPGCRASTPARRSPRGASRTSTHCCQRRRDAGLSGAPFLFLGTRAEDDVAQQEYDAVLAGCGLRPDELVRSASRQARSAGRPRRLVRDHPGRRALQRLRPRGREVAGPAPGRGRPPRPRGQVVAADFPFLGACYGIGVLGTLPGGVVDRTFGEPIGALPVRLTAAGRDDPLFGALPAEFTAYLGHKEAVARLPDGAVLLASTDTCPVHAFRIGAQRLRHPVPPRARRRRASATGSTPTAPTATTSRTSRSTSRPPPARRW